MARADKRFITNNIPENVGRWIDRSRCFVVDISEANPSVMMELGYMCWRYSERPLILLQRQGTHLELPDIKQLVRIPYPWSEQPDQVSIANVLRSQLERFDELKTLKGAAHYLSTRIMPEFLSPELKKLVVRHYETVEEFVNKDAAVISQELGTRTIGVGAVQDIQTHLRGTCKLS